VQPEGITHAGGDSGGRWPQAEARRRDQGGRQTGRTRDHFKAGSLIQRHVFYQRPHGAPRAVYRHRASDVDPFIVHLFAALFIHRPRLRERLNEAAPALSICKNRPDDVTDERAYCALRPAFVWGSHPPFFCTRTKQSDRFA
jgi:hypothetical protein